MKNNFLFSGFFRFFTRVFDLMWLNILFLVCCLPIITIGASTSALYSVCLKLVRNEETYVTKDFFHAFRQNLKQGIFLHLILSLITIIVAFDLFVMWNIMEYAVLYKWAFIVMIIFSALFFIAAIYVYPLLAQFNNTVKGYLRAAFGLALKHFPYSVMFLLLTATPIAAALLIPGALEWEILICLMIGFSGMVYMNSCFFSVIFNKYIKEETQ